jgi:hypothetical protein
MSAMSSKYQSLSTETYPPEMQELLRTASQNPWGPGHEIDAKVHTLHQLLVEVVGRLESNEAQPDDEKLAHAVSHELRNKLMVFQHHELERSRATLATLPKILTRLK